MRCSVIIPCHGGEDLTRACIESLLGQRGGHELEILVVDNKSPDGTGSLANMHPAVRVLPMDRNLGFAGGVNRGLREASMPHVLILNNDTVAGSHLLTRLHRALTSDPRIGIAAPMSDHVKGDAMLRVGQRGQSGHGREEIEAFLSSAHAMAVQDQCTLSGLCMLIHRSTQQRIGEFDERFGPGNFEDDDFCLRARLLGMRLVLARDAFLHHEGHSTFRAMGLDYRKELENRRRGFEAKWNGDPAGAAWISLLKGDLAAAGALAPIARREHPCWVDADWILACWHAASGRTARAIDHVLRFLECCPSHADALLRLSVWLLRLGRPRESSECLRQALDSGLADERKAAAALRDFGEVERGRGRPELALEHFRGAVELQPEDADLRNWLGIALLECGRFREAVEHLERSAELGCDQAHTNLGICHFRLGDRDRAEKEFAIAAERMPHDEAARSNLQAVRGLPSAARPVASQPAAT
ncbi:MAG: hypothetical protein Fur0037_21060 [Planctomycetota bacterium]